MTETAPEDGHVPMPSGWDEVMAAIADLPRLVGTPPIGERAEGIRYLLRFLAAGLRVCIEADDTDAPMLTRSIEHRMTWGLDNPDTTYLYARVAPDATHRLTGTIGTARHVEVQVNTGHQGDGDFTGWTSVWWRSRDDMDVADDGTIDVEIPACDEASFLFVRQYFSDWSIEQPARLDLQRTDRALPPAPLADDDLDARLALLAQWLRDGADCWDQLSAGFMASVEPRATEWSVTPFLPPDAASGLKGQAYGMGGWRCEPDEAVVVTLRPPPSRYWGVSLCDRWWQSIDFAQRQSSLNDAQAVIDDDGSVTMVISHHDPGVANWLDPGGRSAGSVAVRYLFPADGDLPPATFERLPASSLPDVIEARSLARCSATDRQMTLRRRQADVARRLGW